ncbi:MAG: phenylacetate--CoA ligase [Clostridiales bacterium]|jgi:phenylacetate-CoA ligase|nr:phenylacetate--CoA ligase [Clostridiales bacterium]
MEYFQKNFECMKRSEMRALQLERLKKITAYCYDNCKIYKDKFDKAGLKPSHIRSLEDIKLIPFTTKEDFFVDYPYGIFSRPLKDIVRIHASSGTTGRPTVVGYTRNDLEMWSDVVARFAVSMGGNAEDIVQISFGYGLFTGAFGLHKGWEKIGAAIIPVSSGNTERQVMLLREFKSTVLVATPSYGLYIAEALHTAGYTKDDICLRLGFFGAEASTRESHAELSRQLGIVTNDNYGLSEITGPGVSGECIEKTGMHIAEDHFYPEIVDKNTLEPIGGGEVGELVLTTLTKEGMPILRYRTKDLTRLNYDVCKCGRTSVRMDKVIGRTDDMLIIRGVNVFPSQIESVLMELAEVGNNYEIIVKREGYLDTLEVKVEVVDGALLTDYSGLERLRTKIKHKIKSALQIEAAVRLVEPSSLKRYEGKAKRVFDLRNTRD